VVYATATTRRQTAVGHPAARARGPARHPRRDGGARHGDAHDHAYRQLIERGRGLSGWVYALDRRELAKATEEHIRRLVGHWAGRVAVWDVVNEPITERGGLKRTPFERKLGPGHIATAFRIAQRADPKAKLHINETGAEGIGPKSDRLYELVRDLRARGVPIDGVGFQVHTTLGGLPSTFVDNLRRFAALGVEIAITEADVSIKLPPSAADLRAQARVRRHRARLPGDQGVPLADALGLHRRALVDLRAAAGLRRGDDPG